MHNTGYPCLGFEGRQRTTNGRQQVPHEQPPSTRGHSDEQQLATGTRPPPSKQNGRMNYRRKHAGLDLKAKNKNLAGAVSMIHEYFHRFRLKPLLDNELLTASTSMHRRPRSKHASVQPPSCHFSVCNRHDAHGRREDNHLQ